jgi:CBS domain-containing protein
VECRSGLREAADSRGPGRADTVRVTAAQRTAAAATTGLTAPAETPVAEAMSGEILAVATGASLGDVARTMARHGVHGVAVEGERWGFVSDLDLVAAATGEDIRFPPPAVTVPADATLVEAGRLMGRHEVSHLLVTDFGGRAVGVVSALDVARHIAFGRPAR